MTETRNPLLGALTSSFDLEELRTLCFDLDVPYDDLRGEGRQAKARELILYLQRRGQLADLVGAVSERRPALADGLRAAPPGNLTLPDGLAASWWGGFRRSPLPLQVLIGLAALAVLALLGLAVYTGVQAVLPHNPWGPDVPVAKNGETLILIAGFPGPPAGDLLPEQRIAQALRAAMSERRDVTARVELVSKRQIKAEADARAWGQAHSARLVIWGWYDADRVQVYLAFPQAVNIRAVGSLQPVERSASEASWQLNQALPERTELASLVALGWLAYTDGGYDAAAGLWDSVIARVSAYPSADQRAFQLDDLLVLRGSAAEARNDTLKAQAAYAQAGQVNPANLTAAFNSARLALAAGDAARAAAETGRIVATTPAPPPELLAAALIVSAQAQAELGRLDDAAAAAARAVSLAPTDAQRSEALMTQSDIHLRRRAWPQAAEAARQAIALTAADPIAYFNLGRALLHSGATGDAEQAYRNALARTQSADSWLLDGALAELQTDAATYPDLAGAIERVRGLILQARK